MKTILSIIIPVYNQINYLESCLESVLKQNSENIELILVDDGSTDGSEILCDKYEKIYNNIHTIHKKNGGLSSARNEGILMSQGQYLLFLDSDDEIADDAIECLLNIFENNVPDMVLFNYCYKTKKGYKLNGTGKSSILSLEKSIELLVKNQIDNQICFKAYKRNLFSDIKFPVGRNYEDIATFYKLLLCTNKNIYVDFSLYIYNITNMNSITQSFTSKNLNDMYLSINEFEKGLMEICKKLNLSEYLEYYKRNIYIYIYIKSKRCKKDLFFLRKKIEEYLWENNKYNKMFKYYSPKRCIYFYLSTVLRRWFRRGWDENKN